MNSINIIKSVFLTLGLIIVCFGAQAQQETQFTHFMNNRLYYNPAFAGAPGMATLTAIYRNQWLGLDGSPESKLISFSTPFAGKKIGLGLTIVNYSEGIMNNWAASMAYSYNIKINDETSVRLGLQGSMRYLGIDFADPAVFVVEDNDPSFSDEMLDKYTGNFGLGVYLTHKQLYFGISVPHFFPNEISFNNQNQIKIAEESPHYYMMAGAMLPVSESMSVRPSILFKYVQNAPFDMDLNVSLIYANTIEGGISYRLGGNDGGAGESIDLTALYKYNNFGIGLAYDFGLSDLNEYNSGSLEVLLRYNFAKERDDIANPRFFF